MTLLDELLAANAAIVAGEPAQVPRLPSGRALVVVACSESRRGPSGRGLAAVFGLAAEDVLLVCAAGARVGRADGDRARSVAVGLARRDGGEVLVIAHDRCAFLDAYQDQVAARLGTRAPAWDALRSFCGERYMSPAAQATDAARTLRSSPFLPAGTVVHALVVDDSTFRVEVAEAGYGAAIAPPASGAAPGAASLGAATGPVSFFAGGAAFEAPPPIFGEPSPVADAASVTPEWTVPPPAFTAAVPDFVVPPTAPPPRAAEHRAATDWELPPPEPPPPPPPPRSSPAKPGQHRKSPAGQDPFARAEEILERLRRERRK